MNHYTRLAVLLVLMIASSAHAANCALRNPDRQIYEIFPKATAYRTIVSAVGEEQIALIKERYGLDLALTDRGKHTLYVVMKNDVPIGFIHARAEVGERGSVELVWAIDLDLRILEFRVQRSREKHTQAIKSDAFHNTLISRDIRAMSELIRTDGEADLGRLNLPSEAQAVATTAIRCGLNCLAITQIAFEAPLTQARLLGMVHRTFPDAANVKRIAEPLEGTEVRVPLAIKSTTALRAVDANGATLGILVRMAGEYEFWCGIDVNGKIKHAMAVGASDFDYVRSVAALPGTDLATARTLKAGDLRDCAIMALVIASQHGANNTESVVTGE